MLCANYQEYASHFGSSVTVKKGNIKNDCLFGVICVANVSQPYEKEKKPYEE